MDTRSSTARARAALSASRESQSPPRSPEPPANASIEVEDRVEEPTRMTSPSTQEDEDVEGEIARLTAVVADHERQRERRRVLENLKRQVEEIRTEATPANLTIRTRREPSTAPMRVPSAQSRPREESSEDSDVTVNTKRRRKEKKTIAAPQPSFYGGEGRGALKTFCRTCEQQFLVNPELYSSEQKKVLMAQGFLTGDVADAWERLGRAGGQAEMTWERFKDFLLDELSPATLRGIDVGRKWNDARQGPNQSVRSFATYLDQLYDMMTIEQTEATRCEKFLYGLRPEVYNILVERREGQNRDRNELLNSAVLAEASLDSRQRGTVHHSFLRDRPLQPRRRPIRPRSDAPPTQGREQHARIPASGSNRQGPERPNVTCGYCGIKGHSTEACYKRKNAEHATDSTSHPKGQAQ